MVLYQQAKKNKFIELIKTFSDFTKQAMELICLHRIQVFN